MTWSRDPEEVALWDAAKAEASASRYSVVRLTSRRSLVVESMGIGASRDGDGPISTYRIQHPARDGEDTCVPETHIEAHRRYQRLRERETSRAQS